MTLPDWAIQGAVIGTITFVFRTVFGLIEKNKAQSEIDDRRLEDEIKAVRSEMREMDARHRENENSLFEKCSHAQAEVAHIKGIREGSKT